MNSLPGIAAAIMVGIAGWQDLKTGKIPNPITMSSGIFGLMLHGCLNGLDGFWFSFAGIGTGTGILFILYLMGAMGAGDVKLMGAVGSFLGATATFEAFLLTALFGGVYSLAVIFIQKEASRGSFSGKIVMLSSVVMLKQSIPLQTETSGQKPRLKYGVAIALGTITHLILNSFGVKLFF